MHPIVAEALMHIDEYDRNFDAHFVASVRAATAVTFRTCAFQEPQRAYCLLTEELRSRGIEPDTSAIFDAAILISQGRRPAVLEGSAPVPD